jgi:hypothetical protein
MGVQVTRPAVRDLLDPPMHARAALILLLLTASAGVAVSCNIVGPAAVLISGPPTVPALYELDKSRNHIIFIDDLRNRVPRRSLRDEAARTAEEIILKEKLLPEQRLISHAALSRTMSDDRYGSTLSVVELGKRAGADVVIYITMDGWGLTRDGASAAPFAAARVKIIDCASNKRLWPPIEEGYRLEVSPSQEQGALPGDLSARSTMEQQLARRFGLGIAQMFFKHERTQSVRK